MKKQSGISLVALIITIIVMVILAGIIIASAVADGGIIDRVQGAAKEHERAEIEDLVIASYMYKETASQGNNYAVLDLDQTAEAIYKNLTDNGFTIKGKDGEESEKVEDFYDKGSGDNIEIEVEGNYGEYTGEVNKDGLIDGINPKPEPGPGHGPGPDPEQTKDLQELKDALIGEFVTMEFVGKDELTVGQEGKKVTIKTGNELYTTTEKIGDSIEETSIYLCQIEYKGNKYITVAKQNGKNIEIYDVEIEQKTKFKYGKTYANEELIAEFIMQENGATQYTMINADTISTELKIFRNEIFYFNGSSMMYQGAAKISEDGNSIFIKLYEEGSNGSSSGNFIGSSGVTSTEFKYMEDNFHYDEEYICPMNGMIVKIENDTLTMEYQGQTSTIDVKILVNYILFEDDGWEVRGKISEDGKSFELEGVAQFILKENDITPLYYDTQEQAASSAFAQVLSEPTWGFYIGKGRKVMSTISFKEGIIGINPGIYGYFGNGNVYLTTILGGGGIVGNINSNNDFTIVENISTDGNFGAVNGKVHKSTALPVYNSETGLEIYDTNENIDALNVITELSGTISYWVERSSETEYKTHFLIKNNGTYFIPSILNNELSSEIELVFSEDNTKITVEEIDSELNKTGNTIEYTINGTKLENKKVITAE